MPRLLWCTAAAGALAFAETEAPDEDELRSAVLSVAIVAPHARDLRRVCVCGGGGGRWHSEDGEEENERKVGEQAAMTQGGTKRYDAVPAACESSASTSRSFSPREAYIFVEKIHEKNIYNKKMKFEMN